MTRLQMLEDALDHVRGRILELLGDEVDITDALTVEQDISELLEKERERRQVCW